MGGPSLEHWYTLHTQPRKEHAVRELLQNRGIEAYLPVLPPPRRRPSRPGRERAFFARYLFARLDFSQVPLSSINWLQGMTGVVSFGGEPAEVPDGVIRWLRARLAQADAGEYHRGLVLKPDARLRVTAGPLRGMEAIFERRLSAEDRARVLVQLLGRITACEIPLDWLEQI